MVVRGIVSAPVARGLRIGDLAAFPDDGLRRELIDGELYVSPSPVRRHQHAVAVIVAALLTTIEPDGGLVYPAPMDVVFSDDTVVEPDVVALSPDAARNLANPAHVDVTPTLLVEVSSPSTRRLDLIAKRALYEREGVPVYWFVDLDADRVDVHVLHDGRYGAPTSLDGDEHLWLDAAPRLTLPVADVLAG